MVGTTNSSLDRGLQTIVFLRQSQGALAELEVPDLVLEAYLGGGLSNEGAGLIQGFIITKLNYLGQIR